MPHARLLGTAVGTTALLGIAHVRRGRAEEGAIERLVTAPSELTQHLAVERTAPKPGYRNGENMGEN